MPLIYICANIVVGTEGSGGYDILKAFSPYFKHLFSHSNVVHTHMLYRQRETKVLVQTGYLTSCVQSHLEADFL